MPHRRTVRPGEGVETEHAPTGLGLDGQQVATVERRDEEIFKIEDEDGKWLYEHRGQFYLTDALSRRCLATWEAATAALPAEVPKEVAALSEALRPEVLRPEAPRELKSKARDRREKKAEARRKQEAEEEAARMAAAAAEWAAAASIRSAALA